jgi:hypothetical protein
MKGNKNVLDYIWDTQEAATQWGLSQVHVKQLAKAGKINAKKVGTSWAIDNTQQNPRKYKTNN